MAEQNEQERLAEQQAKFNAEALKSEAILTSLSGLLGASFANLDRSSKKVRDLNTELGQGVDITRKLNAEILASGVRIEELEFQRQVNLAKYATARSQADKLAILDANRQIAAQLTVENQIRSQLKLLEDHLEKEKAITEEKKKQNSLSGNAKKLLGDMVKSATELFTVAGFLKNLVDAGNQFDKASVNISKNLGMSSISANGVAIRMEGMSLSARSTTVNMKNLIEAQGQLNSALGLAYEFSAETLKTQIMLTKQFGLTGEEAAGIYQFSVLAGKSSEKINDEMVGAFVASKNSLKVGANFKEVMAEAAKVSGQLSANFKNNPALITAAIVQAKALGTTLEQTKDQGKSLLNFEESISNELEAELMTGQQMNLERARAAALQGDQVTVMKELNNQGMTLEKFQNMNVLAQDSFAKAIGLTGDKLAEQLKKQKMAQESGKSLAEITKEDALEAEKRQSIQDRFNDAVEKLKDIFGIIGVILTPIAQILTWMVDNTWAIYAGLLLWAATSKGIGGTFKGIVGSMKSIGTGIMNKVTGKGGAAAAAAPAATPATEPAAGGKGGGMLSSLKGISTTDMIKGAAAILILAAALWVAAKAFQEFAKVNFPDVMLGIGAIAALAAIAYILGKAEKDMMKGAVAVAILGVALIPFAYAMSLIGNLDIGNVLAAAAGLVIFAAAAAGLGFILPFVLLGAIGIAALGVSLVVFGAGLQAVVSAGTGITELFKSLTELDTDKLTKIAPALLSIGEGIMALGAGSIMIGIGGKLGGGPVAILKGIAESGDGLQKAATGLQAMAGALTQVASALSSIDVSKLEALDKFASNRSTESVIGGITSFLTAPIKAIGSMAEGAGGAGGNTEMVKAINEVRDAVNKLYAKDQSIHMDGKKVGTTLTQSSHKVA